MPFVEARHNLREWNTQVVIPVKYRSDILKMAHDMPMAGHTGVDRTLQRIRKSFWWPRVAKDVKTYVQSCPECQRVAKRPAKVPLVKIPIIGQSFSRMLWM